MREQMPTNNTESTNQEKELSSEALELIETASLTSYEKMELLLIAAGSKPVTDITLYSETWRTEDVNRHMVDKDRIEELRSLFTKLNLKFKISEPSIDKLSRIEDDAPDQEIKMQREKIDIYIAKDEDSLGKLAIAMKTGNDEAMGALYGFPQTAVEAYLGKRESIKRQELPDEVREKEFYPFIEFGVLSKDNWQEEIATAESWANVVKRNSPKLFQEYTDYIHNKVSGF